MLLSDRREKLIPIMRVAERVAVTSKEAYAF